MSQENIVNFIKAFKSLSPSEKRKVVEIVKALENAGPLSESRVIKSFGLESASTTINFAPAPGRCPACGK